MRFGSTAIAGMALAAGAIALLSVPDAAGAASRDVVTVHRGAAVETLGPGTPGAAPAGAVEVVRGAPLVTAPAAPAAAAVRALAGRTLWLVDREQDRLTACHLRDSTQVGRRVVRCWSRPLPD
ncbi:MAG: hypothetical protein ACE5GS_16530 [Kiloniellaceae bacterium]